MSAVRTYLTQRQKAALFTAQNGKCGICDDPLEHGHYHDDHRLALIDGGGNEIANRRLVCAECHKIKSAIEHSMNAKTKRLRFGRPRKSAPMPGSKRSRFKRHMDGTVSYR